MKKRLIILIGVTIVSQMAMAQWRLSASVSLGGNCSGSIEAGVWKAAAKAIVEHYNGKNYASRQECEQARMSLISNNSGNMGGCSVRIIASCNGSGGVSNGAVDILGVGKGSSFYSINPVNEINDWSSDDMERMLALDMNFKSFEPTNVSTGDVNFDLSRSSLLSGRMPDGSTKYIKNANLLQVIGQANNYPGTFSLSSDMMPITMTQPESGVYVPPIHDAYTEMLKIEEEKKQRELDWEQTEAIIWDEIKTKLDETNSKLLAYILETNNGGIKPKFLGITESGYYAFESNDGNNVFLVSKDAHSIHTLTFEEHSWNDENIIKAIQERGFKDVFDERFKFEIKGGKLDFLDVKDGKISFKDLENLSSDKIRKLLPYIEGEIKLKLFDNSSELSYSYMHLFDSHISLGGNATLSSGGKDNVSASLSLSTEGNKNEMGSNGNAYFSGSTSTQKDGLSYGPIKIRGNAKAEIELMTGKIEGTTGYVQNVAGKYIYCSGNVELRGGTKISKNLLKSPWGIFYAKGNIGGIQCKNITNYSL